MPDSASSFLDQFEQGQPQSSAAGSFLDQYESNQPKQDEEMKPTLLQKWTMPGTFIHTLGDTLGRLGSGVQNLASAGGNLLVGDTDDATKRLGSAVKGLPGIVGGAVDLVGGRLGLPSAQEAIDKAVGYGESDRMTGQKLLKEAGVIERSDNPLFSVPGAAGIALDVASDPLTYMTGGLTKAGKAVEAETNSYKYLKNLDEEIARATAAGNAPKAQQLGSVRGMFKATPAAPQGLAPTRALQAEQGQRALLQIGDTPLVKGAGVYKVADKIGEVASKLPGVKPLKDAFYHGPVTQVGADTERQMLVGNDAFHKMRQSIEVLRNEIDPVKRAALNSDIEKSFDTLFAPNTGQVTGKEFAESANLTFSPHAQVTNDIILKALEEGSHLAPVEARKFVQGVRESFNKMGEIEKNLVGGNTGTDALQITAHNKNQFAKFDTAEHAGTVNSIRNEMNQALVAKGKAANVDFGGGLRQMVDKAHREGLTVRELNRILWNNGIKNEESIASKLGLADKPLTPNVLPENPADILYMRGAQHVRANGVNDYITGLQKNGLASEVATPELKFAATMGDAHRSKALYFADKQTAQLAEQTLKLLANPGEAKVGLRLIDKINNSMRSGVTKYFPEFHLRNHISNLLQSSLEGVPIFGKHRDFAADFVAGKPVTLNVGGKTLNRDEFLKIYNNSGASKGGFFEPTLIDAAPLGGKKGVIGRGMEHVENAMAAPAGAGIIGRHPEMIGKVTGNMVEELDRVAHFAYKLSSGLDPVSAARSVDKSLFNYASAGLTPFENSVMKRAVLFYGYQRNALPLIFEKAMTEPGKIATMVKLGTSGGHPDAEPAYLNDQQTAGLPNGLSGLLGGKPRQDLVASSLPSPLGAAVEPISALDQGAGGVLRYMLSKAGPIANVGYELASGKKAFNDRPAGTTTDTLLNNIPTSRLQRAVSQEPSWDWLAKLSGIGTSKIEPQSQQFFNAQAALKPQLERFESKGYVKQSGGKYYVVPDAMPPETLREVSTLVKQYNVLGETGARLKHAISQRQAQSVAPGPVQ